MSERSEAVVEASHDTHVVEPTEDDDPRGHDHGHGLSDLGYVKVAAVLSLMTAAEVTLTYLHIGPLFLPILLILMAAKFLTVVSMFMHLRFDNKIFSWLFYAGLGLAVLVYMAALSTFHFFQPG